MKSFKRFAAVTMLSAVIFLSCATTGAAYSELSEENTPENSVVMIFVGQGDFDFVQVNPEYKANRISIKDSAGCTTPLEPGSCYMKVTLDSNSSENWIGVPGIYGSLPFAYLNAEQTEKLTRGRRVTVPTEPGLYVYYPQYDIDAIKSSGAIVIGKLTNEVDEWKDSSMMRNYVLKRFKACAKVYAGTSWELLIDEYVEEWSK